MICCTPTQPSIFLGLANAKNKKESNDVEMPDIYEEIGTDQRLVLLPQPENMDKLESEFLKLEPIMSQRR